MNPIANDILMHYGVGKLDGAPGRGSGRYPLGSGENPNQHSGDILSRVKKLEEEGLSEKEIATALGLKSTTQLRVQLSLAKEQERSIKVATARRLREEGYSLNEITKKMGYENDSSVRSLLNEKSEARMNQARKTAELIKAAVDEKGMIDVGLGVEKEMGISREKLNQALYILELEGYPTYGGGVPTGPGKQTNMRVICPPGTPHKDIYQYDKIHTIKEYEKILVEDGSRIVDAFRYPASLDSKRLDICYAEQGGLAKDGVIEIRRNVPDLSLGEAHYAQVRILVDGTHYLKGMAVYADDLPEGIDIRFNTNKKLGTPVLGDDKNNTVLKQIKNDPDNPFGALIKPRGGQYDYIDPITGEKKLSPINKNREEGDWGEWSDHLPSQFLSKQPLSLAQKQLDIALADKRGEYADICALTNPTIKKAMLSKFAASCDSDALHLQAAAFPRQKYQVILPLDIPETQVYAPNYRDGERVALIRYPHGGTFEIPIVTVNNKIESGKRVIGTNAADAIGISSKVAERLSGADFDGDTVMVIPLSGKIKVTSTNKLKDLEGFDPKIEYGPDSVPPGTTYKHMSKANTQMEMGKISNLITDMTLKGAKEDELARAVRHSMVVIDAEKHNLDYQRSFKENGIAQLKRKYQGRIEDGKYTESASTLISRAKAEKSVIKRQGSPRINQKGKPWYDPERPEGALIFKETDQPTYVNKKGKTITRTQRSRQMDETDDARTLSSGTQMEDIYANYANSLKALANDARKTLISTGKIKYDARAKEVYKSEVDSLNAKLNIALRNKPRERQAQTIANAQVNAKFQANPDMTKKEIQKAKQIALTAARAKVGAERHPINITDREWEAIQSGAISETKLSQIIQFIDDDKLKQRATPKNYTEVSQAKQNKIKAMKNSGYTNAQIADALQISASTVSKYS